jgi:hypothetical protein
VAWGLGGCGGDDDPGSVDSGPSAAADASGGGGIDAADTTDAAPGGPDAATFDAGPITSSGAVVVRAFYRSIRTCLVRDSDGTLCCQQNDTVEQIGTDTDWEDIVVTGHSCGLKTDGTAWCWGLGNNAGEQGNGTTTPQADPTQVVGSEQFADIAVVSGATCAIHVNGTLWCWGDNYGTVPVQVGTETNWKQIGGLVNYIRAVRTDGTLWDLFFGISAPPGATQRGTDTDWETVGNGGRGQCMTKTDGTMWCITGTTGMVERHGGVGNDYVTGVHTDIFDRHALSSDGTLWKVRDDMADPIFPTLGPWTDLHGDTAGGVKCMRRTDGELWCWGLGPAGSMGTSAELFEMEPIPFTLP